MVFDMYHISKSKYAKKLHALDFPNLFCGESDPELYLKHCEMYDMKFLKGSYGTIVHKDFKDFFRRKKGMICEDVKKELVSDTNARELLDHYNVLESRHFPRKYVVTSSPYNDLEKDTRDILEDYPYQAYIINPNFLDYHAFIIEECKRPRLRNPLDSPNFAFTKLSTKEMGIINDAIYDRTGIFNAFWKF